MNEVTVVKDDHWSRGHPVWRVLFPVNMESMEKIKIPGLDMKVEVDYIAASVSVVGKQDAEKVAKRVRAILEEQHAGQVD